MNEVGYKPYTVADLISDLAGLPPMMEVMVWGEKEPLFISEVDIGEQYERAPVLLIWSYKHPKPKNINPETYDEQLAKMRQKAMHMAAVSEKETQMHRIVD